MLLTGDVLCRDFSALCIELQVEFQQTLWQGKKHSVMHQTLNICCSSILFGISGRRLSKKCTAFMETAKRVCCNLQAT